MVAGLLAGGRQALLPGQAPEAERKLQPPEVLGEGHGEDRRAGAAHIVGVGEQPVTKGRAVLGESFGQVVDGVQGVSLVEPGTVA